MGLAFVILLALGFIALPVVLLYRHDNNPPFKLVICLVLVSAGFIAPGAIFINRFVNEPHPVEVEAKVSNWQAILFVDTAFDLAVENQVLFAQRTNLFAKDTALSIWAFDTSNITLSYDSQRNMPVLTLTDLGGNQVDLAPPIGTVGSLREVYASQGPGIFTLSASTTNGKAQSELVVVDQGIGRPLWRWRRLHAEENELRLGFGVPRERAPVLQDVRVGKSFKYQLGIIFAGSKATTSDGPQLQGKRSLLIVAKGFEKLEGSGLGTPLDLRRDNTYLLELNTHGEESEIQLALNTKEDRNLSWIYFPTTLEHQPLNLQNAEFRRVEIHGPEGKYRVADEVHDFKPLDRLIVEEGRIDLPFIGDSRCDGCFMTWNPDPSLDSIAPVPPGSELIGRTNRVYLHDKRITKSWWDGIDSNIKSAVIAGITLAILGFVYSWVRRRSPSHVE
jgi:hypothetical protein